MNDTPRTEAATDKHVWPNSADNFARSLERELQKAQADAAAMREVLGAVLVSAFPASQNSPRMFSAWQMIKRALSGDAGRELLEELQRLRDDYAELVKRNAECANQLERLRSEVQRAYYEGHIHAISSDPELDPQEHSWPNSRARKIATGELSKE